MQEAVRRHDEILRAAIAQCSGHVFKTVGDAFCCVFARPEEAVAAMVQAQQSLASADFSRVDGLRIRAAVHTGTADERDRDYFGPAVNQVARLLSLAHGGQILLSGVAADLVAGSLPAQTSLRDLGAYRLKDVALPERVHQVLAPGLPADFPPLRSVGTRPADLVVSSEEVHTVSGFTGREEELAALQTAFSRNGGVAVVHGLGGCGKSSVAREYAVRNRDRYAVVWWLNAQTEDDLVEGLIRLGALFVRGLDQQADRRVAARRVVGSILTGFERPVLLVFDNLEHEQLLRAWHPPNGSHVLATSRNAAWGAGISAVPLQTWPTETAVEYLVRESGRADFTRSDAREIALALGTLPLALAHAAAALRTMRMVSPARYLDRVSDRLKRAPHGAEYPHSVFATFNTSIVHAEQEAAGAAAVLCFASSFAPDAIPEELFHQPIEHYLASAQPAVAQGGGALDLRSVIADELSLDEALGALDRLSLLAFAESSRTYRVHRLVQLAARDLAGDEAPAWRECAVAVVDAAFPKADFATRASCGRLLAHARATLDALPSDTTFLPAGRVANRCAVYLALRGDFNAAETIQKRSLAIRERALGPDHVDVAQSVNDLGRVYHSQARYDEAEPLHRRALAIREQALGSGDYYVAATLHDLANVYERQGRSDEAKPLYIRAASIVEKALGKDHPDVAHGMFSVAIIDSAQGRYDEAERQYAQVLATWEKHFGPEHPIIGNCLTNLALVYIQQERYSEAEALLGQSLAIWNTSLGPEHPNSASPLNDLAVICVRQGRYNEAERLFAQALTIWEKTLGSDHPLVAHALNGLGTVERERGRYDEAERLFARALAIREKAVGPNHADVAITLFDLAVVRERQGRRAESQSLHTRALAIREKRLSADHPLTRASRKALDALRPE
jgi:tetratricopeptide (TPR) repeat protein